MHLLTSGSGKNRAIFCISSGNRIGTCTSLDAMIPVTRLSKLCHYSKKAATFTAADLKRKK